ncbi:hybrid sensor histidine kinase/response regulator [Aestuariispira insulae]|uniref:histidine kinase n=1 Tax=Aestuariispira insulae TaxID=1461337 RepID=A0A3D9HW64_9PROT|nr:response regulator [Aestuariispira insulae]RED53754.1 two-component system sensor histidine kinase ChiS [Aestuariispira insulae]
MMAANSENNALDRLANIRNTKENELNRYLDGLRRQTDGFARSDFVKYSVGRFYGFSHAFHRLSPDPDQSSAILRAAFQLDAALAPDEAAASVHEYLSVHDRFHAGFAGILETSDFDNLYLVDRTARVVYAAEKDGYFSKDLTEPALADSILGKCYRRVMAMTQMTPDLNDVYVYMDYAGLEQGQAAIIGRPIVRHGSVEGVALYQLPQTPFDQLFKVPKENQLGTRIYAVGSEGRIRGGLPDTNQIESPIAKAAFEGKTGRIEAESFDGDLAFAAFTRFQRDDLDWALIVEQKRVDAMAESLSLRNSVFLIIGAMILGILGGTAYLARSFTAPLKNLTAVSEGLSRGELELPIRDLGRQDELGQLARAFSSMRDSIREQIGLIRQKNAELKEKVQLIESQNLELQNADRMKDDFLAATSHELRTPVNGIVGIAQTMLDGIAGDMTDGQARQLSLVIASGQRLSRLIDDLLDLNSIREGRFRVDLQSIDVHVLMQHVVSLINHTRPASNVEITLVMDEELPPVLADPARLEQVLFNLIGNALKYTIRGRVSVEVRKDGGRVAIAVHDTGPGIANQDMERIFEPFVQLENVSTRRRQGSGLGLTISRQIVQFFGSELHVGSTKGLGASFGFSLAIAGSPAENLIPEQLDQMVPQIMFTEEEIDVLPTLQQGKGRARILIVDDEPVNLQALHNTLQLAGYQVQVASEGRSALDQIQDDPPDVVVLDVMMPDLSGFDVARMIRQDFDLTELPILMLTARSRSQDMREGLASGANDYLTKPFDKDVLLARLENLLGVRQASRKAKENERLSAEIAKREKAEEALRASRRSLFRVLEESTMPVLLAAENRVIHYSNPAAETWLGADSNNLEGSLLDQLTRSEIILDQSSDDSGPREIELSLENGLSRHASLFRFGEDEGSGFAVVALNGWASGQGGNGTEQRKVEALLGTAASAMADQKGRLVEEIRTLEPELDMVADRWVPTDELDYRRAIVAVMTTALDCWASACGKGKVELAEESGIWRAYLDRSTYQTRTLDKYLLVETMPKQPRWRDVLRTGEFVLRAGLEEEDRRLLTAQLSELKRHLRQRRQV